ncbi:MAG: response regulator [Acidobacteria bacterium]|nr:response regulator [Acidobacteriota bacterium]
MPTDQAIPETILVVDDDLQNLHVLSQILSDAGYRVRAATSAAAALSSAQAGAPDLVLLDIKMPAMDGYEVCARLKSEASTRDVPVLFLSVLDDAEAKVKGFESGASDYITKPFQQAEVVARVRTHLRVQSLRRSLEASLSELRLRGAELERTLSEVKTLRGLLPICAECKKVRTPEGEWIRVEEYIMKHSEALCSHGICPDCMAPILGQLLENKQANEP